MAKPSFYHKHARVQGTLTLANPLITESGNGALAGTGVAVSEQGGGPIHQTVFTLTDMPLAVSLANKFGSQKIYDFPEGRIQIIGVVANVKFGVTSNRAATINDNAALKFAIGSAAASNATLATTMVDLLPKTSKTLDGLVAAYTTLVGAALAAQATFDGTTTALDAYFNVGFETATDVDADGTMKVSGTVTITWINLGDY